MRRRWRVRVCGTDEGRTAVVFITPRFWPTAYYFNAAVVAQIQLQSPDADEKLAEARLLAAHYAKQFSDLDGSYA